MTLTAELKGGRLEKMVLIKASPAIVFQALTDAHDLVRWFCDRATSDAKEGGELTASWKSGQKGRAVFKRYEVDSGLELLWVDDGDGEGAQPSRHVISYTIRSKRGSCEVFMRDEDDRPLDEETLLILDQGWNGILFDLKDYCERKERSSKSRPRGDSE